jgi:phage terminase large subunit-like protein
MNIFRAVASDADSLDGLDVHGAIIDEYHVHKTDAVYNILQYGMSGRAQPLTIIITTAGFDPAVPCKQEEDYAKAVLEGRFINESYFAIIYTLDEDDDWNDKEKWIKANPGLNTILPFYRIEADYNKSKDKPLEINKFKTKRLNIWTQAEEIWITQEQWDLNNSEVPEELNVPCYAGLDLSTNIDITAFVPAFACEDKIPLMPMFFIPEDNMYERMERDKVPYDLWVDQGYVIATPGNVIDYSFIKEYVLEFAETYDLRELAYDPYNASQLIVELQNEGIECVEFRQGPYTMSPASKNFEQKVLAGGLAHGGNPVLSWMISCTAVKYDAKNNIQPVKPNRQRSGKRIDGTIASIMAVDRLIRNTEGTSVYEERGFIVI